MLELRGGRLGLDIGHGMRAALVADQQRVALREVPRVRRLAMRRDEPAIGVVGAARRDALGDDAARGVLAEVDHLGAAIDLLAAIRNGDRIELAARFLAAQDAARIFPGDGRTGLHLRPADLGPRAPAVAALGHEIIDATLAFRIAGEPVLHRRILDLGIIQRDQLDHRRMKLAFLARGRGAAFEIGDVGALVGDDQCALELPGVLGVHAEIGGQLHRAAHARRHINEGAVGEHRRIECGIVIVALRHDGEKILLHQLRVLAQRFRDRAENHARLGKLRLEGGDNRDRVEHGIHRHPAGGIFTALLIQLAFLALLPDAREDFLLLQRNAELGIGLEQLGVHLVEALRSRRALGGCVVINVLEVDLRIAHLGPGRLLHLQPAAIGLETALQHPGGLVLLARDEADGVLVQALRRIVGLDVGREAVLVLVDVDVLDEFDGFDVSHDILKQQPLPCGGRRSSATRQ